MGQKCASVCASVFASVLLFPGCLFVCLFVVVPGCFLYLLSSPFCAAARRRWTSWPPSPTWRRWPSSPSRRRRLSVKRPRRTALGSRQTPLMSALSNSRHDDADLYRRLLFNALISGVLASILFRFGFGIVFRFVRRLCRLRILSAVL